jgi:hypothetical protein
MISIVQEHEIKAFLQKKNLSSVISNEIYDHFVVQISELMKNDLSFQEAFLKTKLDWQSELEMVRADIFSFRKITRIEKNVLQSRFNNIMISSFLVSIAAIVLVCFFADFFIFIQIALLGVLISLLIYNFVFKKMKFSDYIQLSFHPLIIRNFIIGFAIFCAIHFFNLKELELDKIFTVFGFIIQIQLLYFRSKKINVLL